MAREERPNASAPARRINPFGPDAMRRWYLAGAATLVVVASLVARGAIGGGEAHGRSPDAGSVSGGSHRPPPADLPAGGPKHDVMAIVNGRDISRQTLAQACVERYGEEVLESLVNKRLIEHHCRKRGVRVTTAEIDAEIDRMSDRFKLGRKQWLELLKNQRGVDEAEYRRDILWPTVALRKLARDEIEPTDAELRRAHESRFGPSVRARLIAVGDAPLAERVRAQAIADPSRFPRLAMEHSKDVGSASLGGLIQPIRMHAGDPELERVAFSLEPGEVSPVVATAGQHVILLCEGKLPARNVTFGEVRGELAATVSEGKLRGVADKLFARLQSSATVKNIYNDADLRQTMAGVVATVNGDRVTMKELGQECLARHGEEVLEVEISQMLLRQAIEGAGLAVTQDDLRSEMLHAAELAGVLDATGNPDLKQWIAAATEQQGVDYERYVRDSVWPSAALKKLTSAGVTVTDEDLQKGFQANYGERVRCRAIVLGSLRRAQEVWDKARQNPSIDHFGELAEQYSIEPSSRSLRGEIPPVRRNGGQPSLEEAAFALAEGELSGIVQVGDKYLILKCEGRTEPLNLQMAEVRDLLERDIYEKKLRLAMGREFERLRTSARIDNYLAGTSQGPAAERAGVGQTSRRRDSAVRPTSATR